MVKISIDGQELQVEDGLTVFQAAERAGVAIPHYCYHPGLPIDGNCRMCLVDIEKMPKPAISCNTRVSEGMVVHTNTPKVDEMRKAVMEFMLLNHPLDCPECDQAGECKLQDYYMKHDMGESRLDDLPKQHKPKVVPLGPNVMLDAERCILCTRCIRFCDEISETSELYIKNRGSRSEITTFPGKELDNAYSTCTVDICPVGALTSIDFRFKKRVWFLKSTNSICTGCATGCNIHVDHSDGTVYRYRPRHNADVNAYWMCDEGRLSYPRFQDKRLTQALAKNNSANGEPLALQEAIDRATNFLKSYSNRDIAFVVSAQQSNENLQAIAAFRERFFKEAGFYYTALTVENPSADDYLIKADKNPNTAGVRALNGVRPLQEFDTQHKLVVVFEHLNESDAARITNARPEAVIGFGHTDSPLRTLATLFLPIPTYWEESGTFTNDQGHVQAFSRCFEPKDDVATIETYFKAFKRVLALQAA